MIGVIAMVYWERWIWRVRLVLWENWWVPGVMEWAWIVERVWVMQPSYMHTWSTQCIHCVVPSSHSLVLLPTLFELAPSLTILLLPPIHDPSPEENSQLLSHADQLVTTMWYVDTSVRARAASSIVFIFLWDWILHDNFCRGRHRHLFFRSNVK